MTQRVTNNPRLIRLILCNERRYWRFRTLAQPHLQPALADEFHMSQAGISRIISGQYTTHHRLSDAQVAEICARHAYGHKMQALANRFSQRGSARRLGLPSSTIGYILNKYSTFERPVALDRIHAGPALSFLTRRPIGGRYERAS